MGRLNMMGNNVPIRPDEWTSRRTNNADYYYVDFGFFEVKRNMNSIAFTAVNLMALVGLYQLIVRQLWPLLIICEYVLLLTKL